MISKEFIDSTDTVEQVPWTRRKTTKQRNEV